MEKEKIIFSTHFRDSNAVPRNICLIASFLLLIVCAVSSVRHPYLFFPIIIFMFFIARSLFFSLRITYRQRSYITLTDSGVSGCSYPAPGCASGFCSFSFSYSEIQHIDVNEDFVFLHTYYGKYKVFTESSGYCVLFFIENRETEIGKWAIEVSKKIYARGLYKEVIKKRRKKRTKR